MKHPDGPNDHFEGVLHFPNRWDAVARASQLRADTALQWGVQYHADSARFRVVLDDVSIEAVRAAPVSTRNESPSDAVAES